MTGKAREYIERQIGFAEKQLKEIRQDIEDTIDSDPELKGKNELLISYKGIGQRRRAFY